jgi:hypothetical protein
MARNTSAAFVPAVDKALVKRLQSPDNWMLDFTSENIAWFNKLLGTIPHECQCDYMTAEAFAQIGRSLTTQREAYRHYSLDMLGQIEAFAIMSAWRLAELSRSSVGKERGKTQGRLLDMQGR